MEKHTQYKILGAVVLVAIAVIVLPLAQNSHKQLSPEKVIVQAPPFPDQSIQVAASPELTEEAETNQPTESLISIARPSVISSNVTPAAETQKKTTVELSKPSLNSLDASETSLPKARQAELKSSISKKQLNQSSPILKGEAWVVQMGSFKNKTNALRLVNHLRASGYQAFIQPAGSNATRVFVGPEAKKVMAQTLMAKIENEVHIKGIIVDYKPFNL